jgi:hypothetical protein
MQGFFCGNAGFVGEDFAQPRDENVEASTLK